MSVLSTTLKTALVLISFTAAAQTWRGSIHGTVLDPSESRVAGAKITVTSSESGKARTTTSDTTGAFTVSLLAPGSYTVQAERDGFRTYSTDVPLAVNQDVRVELRLQPGNRGESVNVVGRAEPLKSDSVSLSTVVESRNLRQLPLDGRNFYELSLLAPGVLPAAQGSAGSVRGDFAINVNGHREDSNNFLLDGVYNGDPKLNGAGVAPPPDAIREFEVLTHTYDASFGRNAGGQINVVLQSGTNTVHGSVWEFFRNASMDSRNYFAPADDKSPRYQRNQFGAAIGGPIRKNKTFFFGDYDGTISREGITRITNVPTLAERSGDFSQSAQKPINLFTQSPFPGNRIPAEFQHPTGRALMNLFPAPNRNVAGQNFISSPIQRDRTRHFDTRLDHTFSPASEFALRYSCADRTLFEPFAGSGYARVPGYGNDIARRAQNVMASETHTFTPALINELRLGFNRIAFGVAQQGSDVNLNRQVGLPDTWSNSRDQGLSFISMPGFSPLGQEYNSPQHSVTNTYQVIDQASYTAGRHLLKFGGEFRRLQQNAFRDIQGRGQLSFYGITGNPVADALFGIPTVGVKASIDNPQALRSWSFALFAHDTLRISPSWTLSAGVRYEYTAPGVDARDRANLYDPATGRLAAVGKNGMPRAGYLPDRNNVAPRVGLTWSPANRGYVVRAAYGIYYDQSALAPSEGLYFSPPYYDLRLYVPLGNNLLSLSDPFPRNFPQLPSSALAIQRDLRTPYAQHWNFNIQQSIARRGVLEVGYVGTKGTRLISARDINQPRPSAAPFYLRPNPAFDDVNILESRSNSVYHSMQARYQQRLAFGLSTIVSYTLGKSLDDSSSFFSSAGDPNFPQDSANIAAERGRSNFDVRQRTSVSYVWDLPIRGRNWLARGWQTASVWSFQTGRPFTVALLSDLDNSNTGRSSLGFGSNDRPSVLRNPELSDPTAQRWFDTGAFFIPARGNFGNAGRNIVEGPGLSTVNASLLKNTSLTERVNAQFRIEAFNLLNRTNYDQPDNFVGSPSFGSILSAGSPRRLQLGLRLVF
ncbi:MAG: carboxypeptidase regulatory-like domain-containing protein [Bryobacteraceae bacterium]|nr:carboxypeptidase regulatory-like domain-containing protein [Bryobacteraceae bacterium]